MTRTREQIRNEHSEVLKSIEELKTKARELFLEDIQHSDEKRTYTEKLEEHPRPKWARKDHWLNGKVVGRMFWSETYTDDDTGEKFTVNRQEVVKVDGKWLV